MIVAFEYRSCSHLIQAVHNDDKTAPEFPEAAMDTGKVLAKQPADATGSQIKGCMAQLLEPQQNAAGNVQTKE
eukprot:COSAG06_NODE_69_length_26016_cov_6.603272_6_plen_73_part_00